MSLESVNSALIVKLEQRVDQLDHDLNGNGNPGIRQDVGEIKEYMHRLQGAEEERTKALAARDRKQNLILVLASLILALLTWYGVRPRNIAISADTTIEAR